MKTRNGLLIVLSMLPGRSLFCQEGSFTRSPVQVSFIYPIGSHGVQSIRHAYDFSLNILTGYTGSIEGFEVGSLLNMNRGDVSGFQVGGLGNITAGNVSGFQVGGLFSLGKNLDGMQVSGIFGKCAESDGLQVSGILNVSKSAKASIAGIANINTGMQKGIQIGGIYNQARELNGVQIGLINRTDTVGEGLSIGLINLIKKGYYDEWTISFADYLNTGVSYKLGLKRLYSIYTIGMNLMEERLWVAGLGIGHLREVNPRFDIQPELMLYTYFPFDFEGRIRETYVSHFKLGLVRNLNQKVAVSVAPSVYLAWKYHRDIDGSYGYDQSPMEPLFDVRRDSNNKLMAMGLGLSLELHIR